ncbi:hypothetical protein [Actinomadura verrucosospora]|uniref:Peptide chain release factor 3 n=1 Tax=Actinomadura verrucosospora TaxID=46165 RepID=A0A7D3VW18_ACTVE|nr:hypothetical protein [Actinomadura verrucosospora]QKG20092.1 peptide chain release factor 3 [Actinomadura verrucosospora]
MLIDLGTEHDSPRADEPLLADLAELSTALALWSGTSADQVLHHLRHHADQRTPDDWPSAARCAAAAFPNDIAADLAREPLPRPAPTHPAPPESGPRPRLK